MALSTLAVPETLPAGPTALPSAGPGSGVLPQPHLLQHHVATVTDAMGRSTQRGWVQDIPGQPRAVQHKAMGLQETAQKWKWGWG